MPPPPAEASGRTAVMKRPNHKDALDQTDHSKGGFFGYKLLGGSTIKENIPLPEERGMTGQEEATAQAGVNDGECELRKPEEPAEAQR